MCDNCTTHRHPINCIIPPYLVDKLAKSKNEKLVKIGLKNKMISQNQRKSRYFYGNLTMREKMILNPKLSQRTAAVVNPKPKIEIYDSLNTLMLPGKKVSNPSLSSDPDVKRAFKGSKFTWELY